MSIPTSAISFSRIRYCYLSSAALQFNLEFCVMQFHLDFIQTCMQRLQVAYDNLQQFQPGQIEKEPAEIQESFNTEV